MVGGGAFPTSSITPPPHSIKLAVQGSFERTPNQHTEASDLLSGKHLPTLGLFVQESREGTRQASHQANGETEA
jgi:hypothetical protein